MRLFNMNIMLKRQEVSANAPKFSLMLKIGNSIDFYNSNSICLLILNSPRHINLTASFKLKLIYKTQILFPGREWIQN